jgi:antitoxin component YwqK of YwqJK toxin-antitoxin module
MKNTLYVLAIIVILGSCSYSKVVISENDLPEEIFYLPDEVHPYSGKCLIFYPGTEAVKQEMTFKKGILNGTMTTYYQNGNIKIKGEYKNGRLYGKWESWYEGGKKKFEVNYLNDTLNGEYMRWYVTGVMKEKGLYANNMRKGAWIEYDEAGMILKRLNLE